MKGKQTLFLKNFWANSSIENSTYFFVKFFFFRILEEKNNSLYPGLRFEIAFDQDSIKPMEMPGLEDAESDDFAE